jgi:hypothetical protein
MGSLTTFKVYRYQLLPIDRHADDLYEKLTVAQLIKRKNSIFAQTIPFVRTHRHRGADLSVRLESSGNDAFTLSIGPRRALTRETPDFRIEQIENWPHVTAIILNRPDEQYIVVQDRPTAFANTDTVVKLIERATRASLQRSGLRLHTERVFSKSHFWQLVREYKDKITWIEFEFVTPNMANISNTLSSTLKELAKDTNASQSNLQLRSDPASSLDIDPKDETVQGLVDYTSEGGGDIEIKIKGLRKKIQTSRSIREIQLDDLQLSGPPEQVAGILRDILK